jgi:hypothetical protein
MHHDGHGMQAPWRRQLRQTFETPIFRLSTGGLADVADRTLQALILVSCQLSDLAEWSRVSETKNKLWDEKTILPSN